MSSSISKKSYTTGQTWGALRKCWTGFKVAKIHKDEKKMKQYAERIRALQKELGLKVSEFPELGLTT